MSVVHVNSISGITSITAPSSSDVLTVHTSNNAERLRITTDGKIGIGIEAPDFIQHNYHATDNVLALFESGDEAALIAFQDNNSTNNTQVWLGAQTNDLRLAAGGDERIRLKSDGTLYTVTEGAKFGVSQDPTLTTMGSTSGTWQLPEVDASTIGAEMRIGDINSNSVALIRLASYGSSDDEGGGAIMFTNTRLGSALHHSDLAAIKGARETLGKGYLRFFTANQAANAERMRITSDGKVGINTTIPSDLLTIVHAANSDDGISIVNTNNSQGSAIAQLELSGGDNAHARVQFECNGKYSTIRHDGNGHLKFYTNGSNERLRITSAGALQLSDTNSPNDANTDIWVADDVLNFNAFGTNGAFIFKSGSSSTERLRINSSGYVGVKRSTPLANRHTTNNELALGANPTSAAAPNATYDGLVVDGEDASIINIRSSADGNLSYGRLAFSDDVRSRGYIDYRHRDGSGGSLEFMSFATGGSERGRITSGGHVNIGGAGGVSEQTTHMLHLQSTGDAGIHIRADTDNSGENDNPYLSMSQDSATSQDFKIGMNGDAAQNFTTSIANSPFIHANNSTSQPLQLAHMNSMVVSIANRKNEIGLNDYSGNTVAGMEIQHYGNDTGCALKLTGHNNTGSPGQETFTQFTHKGANLEFEIYHSNDRAMHIGSTRRIRFPGVWGVNGSSMRTVQIESDGNLCAPSSIREAKINIESISDVSWLYDFNPVTFNFRTKTEVNGENVWGNEADDGGLQYGLIADEVEAVNQDLCFYDDGKLSGVHYDRMMSPLIKAVQDQKKEIDALKAKVAALEGS